MWLSIEKYKKLKVYKAVPLRFKTDDVSFCFYTLQFQICVYGKHQNTPNVPNRQQPSQLLRRAFTFTYINFQLKPITASTESLL